MLAIWNFAHVLTAVVYIAWWGLKVRMKKFAKWWRHTRTPYPHDHMTSPPHRVVRNLSFPVLPRIFVFYCEFCDTKDFRWLEERDRQLGKLQSKQETNHSSGGCPSCSPFWSWVLHGILFQWTTCSPTDGNVLYFGKFQSSYWWHVSMEIFLKTQQHWSLYPLASLPWWTDIRESGKLRNPGMDFYLWMHPVLWRKMAFS